MAQSGALIPAQAAPQKPFPILPEPLPLARFQVAEDLRTAIGSWLDWLAAERRASAHTVAAYGRDLAAFFDFLGEHRGEVPSLAGMSRLQPADFRAYLAHRAGDGRERTTIARGLSVLRGFVRFLERRKLAAAPALAVLRAPKLPQSVPKPLTVEDAGAAVAAAGDLSLHVWQQKRDVAILTLLYGCGLRISEALGLTLAEAPRGEALVVTGKGNKQRYVPVLPVVSEAVADYLAACPYPLPQRRAALCRRARRAAQPAAGAAPDADLARHARPARHRDPACVAPQLCDAPARAAAAICGRSRNCSATPACRRPSATPRSSPSTCWRCTRRRIQGRRNRQTSDNDPPLPGGKPGPTCPFFREAEG